MTGRACPICLRLQALWALKLHHLIRPLTEQTVRRARSASRAQAVATGASSMRSESRRKVVAVVGDAVVSAGSAKDVLAEEIGRTR